MNILKEFAKSYRDTARLDPHYARLTSIVGLAGSALGMGIWMLLVWKLFSKLSGSIQYLAILASVAPCVYIGCVLVAGCFAAFMVYRGKFTNQQARAYALYSTYPEYWFRRDA